MKIEIGDYIIVSDPQCMWIEEKYTGETKDKKPKEYTRRITGYIFAGIPELMDDAVLNLCPGEHCFNRCGKPGQIIRASDENILNTPVF